MEIPDFLRASEAEILDGFDVKRIRSNADSPSAILMCNETLEADADMQICPEEKEKTDEFNFSGEDYVRGLMTTDPTYHPGYFTLSCPKSQVRPYMRAILVDNMRMVCANFAGSRECCYVSINIIDRIIALDPEISKENFQLYGIVAVYLASQIIDSKEIRPRLLLSTAEGLFNLREFRNLMHRLLRMLQWKLNPVTTYDILLYSLKEWDRYIETHFRKIAEHNADEALVEGLGLEQTISFWMISFMNKSTFADERALMIFNVLDTSTLTIESYKSRPCLLVGGLLYVILSFYMEKTRYGMLGFNSSIHEYNLEIKASLDESFSVTILKFLSSVLQLPSIDELQNPISLFSVLLQCPEANINLTSFHESENPAKLWRQLHNPTSLSWSFESNLTNN